MELQHGFTKNLYQTPVCLYSTIALTLSFIGYDCLTHILSKTRSVPHS